MSQQTLRLQRRQFLERHADERAGARAQVGLGRTIGEYAAVPVPLVVLVARETQNAVRRSLYQCANQVFTVGELTPCLPALGDVAANDDDTLLPAIRIGQWCNAGFVDLVGLQSERLGQIQIPGLIEHRPCLGEVVP